jgi:hypothetical protein
MAKWGRKVCFKEIEYRGKGMKAKACSKSKNQTSLAISMAALKNEIIKEKQ